MSPSDAYNNIRNLAGGLKMEAQNALSNMQANNIDTNYVYRLLDYLNNFITQINQWKATTGLDSYATGQGYVGSMSADCTTATNAAQACINWVVTNFPTGTGGYLLGNTLNADGSRTSRQFTPTQTAGLQTAFNNFIATIS
jgi:hypothetical protein